VSKIKIKVQHGVIMEKNKNNYRFRITLLLGFIFSIIFSISAASALDNTYYWTPSSGAIGSSGYTANWGSCGQSPTTYRITTLSSTGFICNSDYLTTTSSGDQFLAIYPTAYSSDTAITGKTGATFYLSGQGRTATYRFDLGYAKNGAFTSLGYVTRSASTTGSLYTIDMSSITGTALSGSYLALKVSVTSSRGGRIYLGTNGGVTGSNSGRFYVNETVATPPAPTYNVSISASPVSTDIVAGSNYTYSITINNLGNANGNYTLSVTDSDGSNFTGSVLGATAMQINSGSSAQTTLTITAAANATIGAIDDTTVTVRSVENSNYTNSAQVQTTVIDSTYTATVNKTYYWTPSSGAIGSSGFTANWGSCGAQPTSYRITTLSSTGFTCDSDRLTRTSSGDQFLAIFPTAYSSDTQITGKTGATFYLASRQGGYTAIYRFDLGYAILGSFTSLGYVTQSVSSSSGRLYTIDMSSISGTSPSGSYPALKVSVTTSQGGRIYLGTNGGTTGSNSGRFYVNETAVIPPVPTYNISGYVFDNYGSGLGDVLVQNSSTQNITSTSGYYQIDGLPNGIYNFSYSKAGFNTGYMEVTINGTDITDANKKIYDTTPPASVSSINITTGNFYINNTWINPSDTDLNYTWFRYSNGTVLLNTSKPTDYLNLTWPPHYIQNISAQTVDIYGNINQTKVWFNATIPDNAPVLLPTGDKVINEGQLLIFNISATDADNDTITYGTNATKGIFNTTTGEFSWIPWYGDAEVYIWYFNSSDSYGGVSNKTITVTVNNMPLSTTSSSPLSDSTTIQGVAQNFNISLNRIANVTWYINGHVVKSDSSVISANYTNSTADIGVHNVTAVASDSYDSISRTWNWTVIAQPTYNISGYVFDNYSSGLGGVLVKNNSKQNTTAASGYYLIIGLLNGTYNFNYSKTGFNTGYLEVTISGANNNSANITIYDTTSPAQVTGLINDTPTQTTVNLTWNSAADTNYYQIFRNSTSIGYTKNIYWNDTGLTADTLYEYAVRANDSYNNWGQNSSILSIKTAQAIDTIPPASVSDPTTSVAVGSFYINNTWINPADADYNHTWFRYSNGTIVQNVSTPINSLNLTWSPHYTQNISAQTVDSSGNVNQTKVWFNATIPNNYPVQSLIEDKVIDEGQLLTFTVLTTDADNDTITYGTNATKGTFNTTTGDFSWIPAYGDAGIYTWYFNSSDGYGGVASEIVTVTVNNVPLSITSSIPASDPTTTGGTLQAFEITLNRIANISWYINGYEAKTNSIVISENYTNSTAGAGVYNVTSVANDGYDLVSKQWNWTVSSQPVYEPPDIISWSNSKTNDNNLTLAVNTSEPVNFNAAANQTITTWNWYQDGMNQNNNNDNFTASWNTAGTKTVQVNATNSNGTSNTIIWTVIVQAQPVIYIPPAPINVNSTAGNFWVNTTWQAGVGNTTDSYNASVNGTWHNDTTDTYYNNSIGPHGWINITVWAYNSSGIGSLSSGSVSQNTQVPNNLPIQSPIGNKTVNEKQWLNFTVNAIDLDNDTITYGTNATKGTLNTTTGQFSWTPGYGDAGVYTWYFNSSDGYGGVASETITVTVINVPLSITNSSPASNPATMVGTAQIFGISLNRTANVTWYINGSIVGTNSSVTSANYINSTAGTGTNNVTAIASDGYDSVSRIWTWIVSPQPVYAPDITTWSNSKTNSNSLMLTVNTNEAVNFNATANQTIAAWGWYKDGANQNNNYDNLTTSWNTPGTKIVQVNATNSNGISNTVTWTVTVETAAYIPPSPVIGSTAGNFWMNTTWQAGAGNATDGYNVSVNGSWTNGTTSTYVNSTLSAHAWQNVTVYAYNASGGGSLSASPAIKDTQVPNNPPVQSSIGNKYVDERQWLNFTVHATDADNDAITYSTNATKGTFNATTGEFSWLTTYSDSGAYIWYFNSSDGYGGIASETITVTVNNTPLSITSFSPLSDPTTTQGTEQNFSIALNRTANVTWYMNGNQVQTNIGITSDSYTNSTTGTGTWNVTASATDGIDTVSRTWNWTVSSQPVYAPPGIISWSNNKTNNDSLTPVVNTSEPVNFNATANQTITSWNWYLDGVNQNNNYDNFTVFWNTAGTKTVQVNATNSNGTSNTITWNITVLAQPATYGPNCLDCHRGAE
jgi:hypothetical protein